MNDVNQSSPALIYRGDGWSNQVDPVNEIVGVFFSVQAQTDPRVKYPIALGSLFQNMVTGAVAD